MNNQLDLNLLRTFARILETGSFTKAAKQLHWPKSRVSKAMARLESELNIQLLHRTTRQVTPTQEGKALYARLTPLLEGIEHELVSLSEHLSPLSGTLRLTAPEDIGHTILGDLVGQYHELYPEVQTEIVLSNEYLDLQKNNIDVAFRVGRLQNSSLIQKKIGEVELVLAATPQYLELKGSPRNIKELAQHRLMSFMFGAAKEDVDMLEAYLPIKSLRSRLAINSFAFLHRQALQGKGIALVPDFYCRQDFMSGKLVRVLPSFSAGRRPLHVVFRSQKNLPARVRAFIDLASTSIKIFF